MFQSVWGRLRRPICCILYIQLYYCKSESESCCFLVYQIFEKNIEKVTYSLHLANAGSGGFSFDCPIGQSIGELSPCVPRFCYYERDCFVSTQSRTKSTFWGKSGNFSFCIKFNSRYPQPFPANIDSCILITVHLISAGTAIHTVFQF